MQVCIMAVSCSTYQNIGSTVLPVRDKFLFLLLVEIVTDYRDAPIRFRKKCVVDVEQREGEKEAGRDKQRERGRDRKREKKEREMMRDSVRVRQGCSNQ